MKPELGVVFQHGSSMRSSEEMKTPNKSASFLLYLPIFLSPPMITKFQSPTKMASLSTTLVKASKATAKGEEGGEKGKASKAIAEGGCRAPASYPLSLSCYYNLCDIKWLQMLTKLPILIKGILTADDAELAIKAGAAGIIVSNHGGRQLDYVPATIDALEEVIRTVKGRVPVFVDGGIRRGTDVFKALALGAQAVLVGRPILFGLAVKGETGVKEVLQMLKDEFELAMSLAGCCSVNDIERSHVQIRREMLRSLL